MRRPHKIVAGVAATALALGLGAGATAALPAAFAESATTAAASDVSLTDATHPDNVKRALQYLDQLNKDVRGIQRTPLTSTQIKDANNAFEDYKKVTYGREPNYWEESNVAPGLGTGDALPAFKVNSDLVNWAQTRANELARLGQLDGHANRDNGAPSWALDSLFKSPKYVGGTYAMGPENLAIGFPTQPGYETEHNPVLSWYSELIATTPKDQQGYGHYLTEISQLGNVAGMASAQVTSGRWKGATITVLEIAYLAPGVEHGATQTVEEALHQIAIANEIQSVKTPGPVPVNSGTDPSPQFPKTVTATYGDGHTADVPVRWETPDEVNYKARTGGTFTVHGTIDGYEPGVDITVNVAPATVTSVEQPKDITITVGQSYTLPETLDVTWSNGETTHAESTWDTSAVKADTAGSYTATTTVEGKTVTVKVTVVEAQIAGVTAPDGITVPAGAATDDLKAKLPQTIQASYDNGTDGAVPVAWAEPTTEQLQTLASREGGSFTLHGTVDGWDKGVDVTVTVTKATATKAELSPSEQAVTTPSGTAPTLAKTARVTWSNGEATTEPVTWPELTAEQKKVVASRNGGSFEITGTAQGQPVTVKVTVTPATVKAVAPISPATTEAKHAPELAATAQVTWSNGDTTDETIVWNVTATDYAKRTDAPTQVTGTILAGTDNERTVTTTLTVTAKIVKVADGGTVTTPSGTNPASKLPATVKATWSDDVVSDAPVTWAASTKEQYSTREASTYQLTGTVEGTSLKATVTVQVEAATVTGVTAEPAEVQVVKGTKVSGLPKTVTVTYSNGDKEPTSVTWDTSAVKTDTVGTYTATATVAGQKVSLTVKVVDAVITSVTAPTGVEVASGTEADAVPLPGTVAATWSNGSSSAVAVTWSALTDDQKATLASRKGGTLTVTGTVAGWSKSVTVTVTVTPAKAQTATLADQDKVVTTPSGTAPALAESATVTWSNGDTTTEPVTWNLIEQDAYSARSGGSFQAQGTAAGLTVTADVTVTPATPAKVKTSAIEVATKVGTAPELPTAMTVVWSNGDESTEPVTWDEVAPEQYAQAGTFEVDGTVNVRDAAVPATAGGTAVNPTLRIALRAAQAGEPVGTTFPVTAKVTVTDQVAPEPSDEPTDGASDAASDGGKDAATTTGTSVKRVVASLARTGASVVLLPVAAALVAAGALLIRRRRA